MANEAPYHLLHVFPSFEVGGVQVRTASLIDRLDERFRHSILSLSGDYGCAERLRADAPVQVLTEIKVPGSYGAVLVGAAQTIAAVKPDLLLTYNWASVDWALANALGPHRRHIHHEDGFNADEADQQYLRRILYRRIALRRADLLIVPSQTLAEIARDKWKQPDTKVRLIPNGIDWRDFASCENSPAVGNAATITLGTVAPLRAEKNIAALLRTAAELRTRQAIGLVIVGDGSERSRLEALSRELGLTDLCQFTGLQHDVARALAPIDIFVMPSLTEQMPISLLQAMAAAKPIAAYGVGDVARIVAPENAPFIVARNDETALAGAIAQLADDAALRRRLGDANRARVRDHYSDTTMIERYADAYASVLAIDR